MASAVAGPEAEQGTGMGSGGGAKSPEAEARLVSGRSIEAANLPTFLKLKNAKKSDRSLFVLSLQNLWVATKQRGAEGKLGSWPEPAGPGLKPLLGRVRK